MWLSWIDDLLIVNRSKKCVLREVERVKGVFGVDDVGPLEDYLGCKLKFDWEKPSCRLTQPVPIKSMQDVHRASSAKTVRLPATVGTKLIKANEGDKDVVGGKEQTYYRGLAGQLLHMSSWSRPDISNAVREVSRHGHRCAQRRKLQLTFGRPQNAVGLLNQREDGMEWIRILSSKCMVARTLTMLCALT